MLACCRESRRRSSGTGRTVLRPRRPTVAMAEPGNAVADRVLPFYMSPAAMAMPTPSSTMPPRAVALIVSPPTAGTELSVSATIRPASLRLGLCCVLDAVSPRSGHLVESAWGAVPGFCPAGICKCLPVFQGGLSPQLRTRIRTVPLASWPGWK